jgi:polar amino acid transport system substrate-binding protein
MSGGRRRHFARGLALVVAAATACSCATVSRLHAVDSLSPAPTTTTSSSSSSSNCDPAHADDNNNADRSYHPTPLPPEGTAPPGTLMSTIVERGVLRVGVDQNTLLLSYRDPRTNQFKGFEIDLIREIAKWLFPSDDPANIDQRIEFHPVNTAQKLKIVENGDVDMTISAATPTCARWNEASFTTGYYLAHQKVLMRSDADGNPILADGTRVSRGATVPQLDSILSGRNVCWTSGSTSIDNIKRLLPHAKPYIVDSRTDCLMALQDGAIDAVSTDDTFLLGYEQQDPNTTMLDVSLSDQPYGIVVAQENPELVRFLNGLLLQFESEGTLQALYAKNFVQCDQCSRRDVQPQITPITHEWLD